MGSRLFANITGLLGGYNVDEEIHRRKVSRILGIREEALPRQPSMAYDQIVRGVADGRIKGLWVIATNSSHSWIHQDDDFNNVVSKLDFLVVQDMYPPLRLRSERTYTFRRQAGAKRKAL
jgi:predicted molibdopterin-dependent oxidoreductase YjgC